jgi:hypothetical protein
VLKMTYLIMYSHTCKTRQTRRHSPSRLPRTRYIRQTFANPFPRTRHIRQTFANPFPRTRHIRHSIHSPAFAKMRLAFDTFARVIRHFGEFGASGHCLVPTYRSDDFSGLSDLHCVRNHSGVDGSARSSYGGVHFVCELKKWKFFNLS